MDERIEADCCADAVDWIYQDDRKIWLMTKFFEIQITYCPFCGVTLPVTVNAPVPAEQIAIDNFAWEGNPHHD